MTKIHADDSQTMIRKFRILYQLPNPPQLTLTNTNNNYEYEYNTIKNIDIAKRISNLPKFSLVLYYIFILIETNNGHIVSNRFQNDYILP